MGANPSASQQSTPTSAAANPTPSATDPSAAGATPNASPQSSTTYPPAAPQSTAPEPGATPQSPAPGQVDAQAAKQHLSEARDSLAQLTSLPEAAKLQGDARTQVSQLISNFNELITTQTDWKAAYAKVSANIDMLIGPDSASATGMSGTTGAPPATAGTTGTAGAAAPAMQIEPAIKAKLQEFRTHLKEFEQAAGGLAPAASPSATTGAMAPGANPSSTANPANPAGTSATSPSPAGAAPTTAAPEPTNTPMPTTTSGTSGVPGATGTSGTMAPTPAGESKTEADKHLDAIQGILNQAKDGKLDKSQTDQIKTHLEQLRQLIGQAK